MQKHVVIARFDDETDKLFNNWKSQSYALQNIRYEAATAWPPHLTIAAYENMDENTLSQWTKEYAERNKQLDVHFNSMGVFAHGEHLDTDVIYINPCTSMALVNFYYAFHEKYDDFSGSYGYLYTATCGQPVLHSTITVCHKDNFNQIFDKLRDQFFMVKGKITAIEVYQNPMKLVGRYALMEEFSMNFELENYTENYLDDICEIWNEAIDEGLTLHWTEHIPQGKVEYIISTQIECICAVVNNKCVGFYILHPNSSGRCSHIANALYIVKKEFRGKGIGSALVKHSLEKAKEHGFMAMQYNSVVASNKSVNIYFKSGFQKVGLIPNGIKLNENQYEDLLILYKKL